MKRAANWAWGYRSDAIVSARILDDSGCGSGKGERTVETVVFFFFFLFFCLSWTLCSSSIVMDYIGLLVS